MANETPLHLLELLVISLTFTCFSHCSGDNSNNEIPLSSYKQYVLVSINTMTQEVEKLRECQSGRQSIDSHVLTWLTKCTAIHLGGCYNRITSVIGQWSSRCTTQENQPWYLFSSLVLILLLTPFINSLSCGVM